MSGFLSPPFLKGDLGGLLSGYLIPPCPPLEKGGKNCGFKCHSNYEAPHWAWERLFSPSSDWQPFSFPSTTWEREELTES